LVIYEVAVTDGTRFELERDEAPKVGEVFTQLTMIYKVLQVLPENDEYDGVLQVEHVGGPAEMGRS
jgi:hypothetical protein